MKKMMMAVAGLAMAVVLTGCGGSPKGVAEAYAEALCHKEMDTLVSLMDTTGVTEKQLKKVKEVIEKAVKEDSDLNDDKLSAEAFSEEIEVPSEVMGYKIKDGKKYTGETATVKVYLFKGKDKRSFGLKVELVKVDGKWKVADHDKIIVDEDE